MDFNWFFSALAQSGAALIGIIGAFLISRVLSENDTSSRILYEFRDIAFQRTNALQNLKTIKIDWYNHFTILQSQEFWDSLIQLESESNYDPDTIAELCLDAVYNLYFSPENMRLALRLARRNINENEYEFCGRNSPINDVPFSELENTRLRIENLRHECNVLRHKYGLIKNDINGAMKKLSTIKGIILLLLFGSILSVCFPLLLLPMVNSESFIKYAISYNSIAIRGFFVGSLFLFIAVLCIILKFSLSHIEKSYKKILSKIEKRHLTIEGYSKYFGS
ncbi:MAG: hypothetical protein PHY24_07175 [Candidatus Cloacimonetes bacterium]|nr:hypothetical protein [Candidatus Cloacimonadota bacterium]MDD3533517.1 hypothetical protein [Candidatus Cloacimonadota bacterium]